MFDKHKTWTLAQTEQAFEEVILEAEKNGSQKITKDGEECVWALSAKDYNRLILKQENK